MVEIGSKAFMALLSAVLLLSSGVIIAIPPALATNYEDIAGPAWQGRPAYYITTHPNDSHVNVDESINVKQGRKWSTAGSAEYYKLNAAAATWEPGYTFTDAKNDIASVKSEWTSLTTISNGPTLSDGGNTTLGASMVADACGGSGYTNDGENVLQWCNISPDGIIAGVRTYVWTYDAGLQIVIDEADMVLETTYLGSAVQWGDDTTSYWNVKEEVRHEFGHFIMALGDIYELYGGTCDDQVSGTDEPVMCSASTNSALQPGDKAGAAFHYPKRYSQSLYVEGSIVGADSAVGQLRHSDGTTNSLNDLLIVYVDHNPTDGKRYIRIRPMWDILSSGVATTVGTTTTVINTASPVYDVGATIANINNAGSPDLVITYTKDVSGVGQQHWVTFFDVVKNTANNGISVGSNSAIYTHNGATPARGSDVVIFNFDTDNGNEIGLMHSRESTDTRPHLYIGDINTSGVVSGLFSAGNSGHSSLVIPRAGGDIGFSIVGINNGGASDQRMFSINFDGNNDYVMQHLIHVNSTNWISHGWTNKYGPLYDNDALFLGIGSGDSAIKQRRRCED
ncbi:MAG TPA: hypothetical protein VNI77_04055 [Nitrososphaera sp.]|nr:hypothetical protein [Nitrososphaera sp.]